MACDGIGRRKDSIDAPLVFWVELAAKFREQVVRDVDEST